MSSIQEKLSSTMMKIEAGSLRFMKSMSTILDDCIELKTHLYSAKNLLAESYAEIELKEKRLQEFRDKTVGHERHILEEQLRLIQSRMATLDKEYEKLPSQLTIQNVPPIPIRSQYEVGETSNMSIIPVNIVGEPKESNLKTRKRVRKLKAKAWNYFTKVVEDDGKFKKGQCNYCFKIFDVRSTTCMLKHIVMGKCPVYEPGNGGDKNEPISKNQMNENHANQLLVKEETLEI